MTAQTKQATIHALVVDGSPASSARLVSQLHRDGDITVIGRASSGLEAIERTVALRPDIVVLDLAELGRSGVHAVEQIMALAPTPILVLSPSAIGTVPVVAEALAAGALQGFDVPSTWRPADEAQLRRTVRVLHRVPVIRRSRGAMHHLDALSDVLARRPAHHVVVVAASTGGPSALAILLAGLGGLNAPVLVVQHLHLDFTAGLSSWMSRVSALPVEVAAHGVQPLPGRVYLAPGGVHLRLRADLRLELGPDPDTIHRPSADELFLSAARHAGRASMGVVMTGMGEDGARGLLAIKRQGGRTLAQDEASCAVFGMPAAARRLGAVTEMLPPAGLARAIVQADLELVR